MFGREMRIPLDVMAGGAEDNECSYTDFVTDLERIYRMHRDIRQNREVAQRRQKDAYDKGVKHTVYQPGDLVLRYTPQLKLGEGSKFHRQWQGPYEIVKQVTEVTYLVKKVQGHSRRSRVVHFNNLRFYQKRQEPAEGETADFTRSAEAVEMDAKEVEDKLDTPTMPSDNELDEPCNSDIFQVSDQDGSKVGVDMQAANSDVDTPPVKNDTSPEGMDESEVDVSDEIGDSNHELEEGGATYQSQRPVQMRTPPDRYGEWVLSCIQEIVARLQTLEAKKNM